MRYSERESARARQVACTPRRVSRLAPSVVRLTRHAEAREDASRRLPWLALGAGAGAGAVAVALAGSTWRRRHVAEAEGSQYKNLVENIGNTPLIELRALSALTGCTILGKAEHLNPGGSVKDRPAKWMIEAAERSGALQPGGTIIEATGGNTGVGLAMIAAARGYRAILTMPSNISQDKQATMRTFGAQVVLCPSVPFADPNHFYQTAKRLSEETPGAVWVNQFENMANSQAHYETTGPEIWAATGGRVDALVVSAGTGGTISGLSRFFKERLPNFKAFLIDPYGAGLYEYVRSGKIASEGSSVAYEGIGIMRLTANFAAARVDGAFRGTDREGVEMCYWLLRNEGLWVGPSAALNVVGAVKVARQLGPGHTIVTVLCDSGSRYQNTVFNKEWLDKHNLAPLSTGTDLGFVL